MNRKLNAKRLCLCLAIALLTSGCGLIGNALGGKPAAANALWADVPAMPGLTKSELELPLPARLIIQGIVKTAANAEGGDMRLDQAEAIAFEYAQSPADVGAFYALDKMQAAGWNLKDQSGCGITPVEATGMSLCMFGRTDGAKNTILIIAALKDKDQQNTPAQVFFLRMAGTEVAKGN
jgi:uncharacterized protein YceK